MNYNDELMHYGVKGMKWGVRRYQNEDGTLTAAGRKKYAKDQYKSAKKAAGNKWATKEKSISKDVDDYLNKFERGQISRLENEIFNSKATKKQIANYQQWQNERAKAKRDYKVAIGKNSDKANAKYEKAKNRQANRAQNEWDYYVKNIVKEYPDVANSLAKIGTIKYSDINKANRTIQRGLEAEKTILELENARLKEQLKHQS